MQSVDHPSTDQAPIPTTTLLDPVTRSVSAGH